MAPTTQKRIIVILVTILFAVVAASGAVLLLVWGDGNIPSLRISNLFPFSSQDAVETTSEEGAPQQFNTQVFERSSYKELNSGPIQQGLLPVRPQGGSGKANPFL